MRNAPLGTALALCALAACVSAPVPAAEPSDGPPLPEDLLFFRQAELMAPLAPDVFRADGNLTDADRKSVV